MAHKRQNRRHNLRGFLILVAIVIIGAVLLWSQGDLINPLESTELLVNVSSGVSSFAMVGEERIPAANSASLSQSSADTAADTNTVANLPEEVVATGTMTLETFTAQLATAGVDIEAVSANMSAEGRSLQNLLAVVNSGRVTVAHLATRLAGKSSSQTEAQELPLSGGDREESTGGLLDIHWDEVGSVLYDLWFILAVTVVVIVSARPAGWLVNRVKRT